MCKGENMKIVALCGHSDCGKTTTMNLFIKSILKFDGVKVINTSLVGNGIKDYLDCAKNPNAQDCFIVVEINGIVIGVTTYGDDKVILKENFKNFSNCMICFCCARSKGETRKFVIEKSVNNYIFYNQIRVVSSSKFDYSYVNNKMIEVLLKELKK